VKQPSLHVQLHLRIARLEEELRLAQGMAQRAQDAARDASAAAGVSVELDEAGFLLIHLPGSHTLRWSLGSTQHDYAIAMKALTTVLRERRADGQKMIATPGAPTLGELREAVFESNTDAVHLAPTHPKLRERKAAPSATITLADLGL
jgi:hypothetical protein